MSEIKTGNSDMMSDGFATCTGVCAYGDTNEGEEKMAMWHVDPTQGDAESILNTIIGALGENIDEDTVSIAAVRGTHESSQFSGIDAFKGSNIFPVHATAVPEKPERADEEDWWEVEVYMHPGEIVEYSTPVPSEIRGDDAAEGDGAHEDQGSDPSSEGDEKKSPSVQQETTN